MLLRLAIKSLKERKKSVILAIASMTITTLVLLGVEHIRHQSKENFSNSISGVDLIVGARTGSLNLLLYSIFKIGSPTNNISWQSYEAIASDEKIKWAIPISLGDSHKGYRVVGTSRDFFKYFKYRKKQSIEFNSGTEFTNESEVVLGHEVAQKLDYKLGDQLVLAHGVSNTSFSLHDNHPFTVVGILKPTGTPVDQSLHINLAGMEAIHSPINAHFEDDFTPQYITAFMLGLESKLSIFGVQRNINSYAPEPLSAILPGIALSELWSIMNRVENLLLIISALFFVSCCFGMSAMLIASIRERENEIQLLRIIGASPIFLFLLIEIEMLLIAGLGIITGALSLILLIIATQDLILENFGLHIGYNILSESNLMIMSFIMVIALIIAAIPSIYAYKQSTSPIKN